MGKKKTADNQDQELYLEVQEHIENDLDPHLQELLLAAKDNLSMDPSVAHETESGIAVDIIAKLEDPDEQVPGLHVVRKIGQIVTGTVDLDSIEAVRNHENVKSLKRATKLHQDLEFSVPEIHASESELDAAFPSSSLTGSGVIVGVVDFGCDFMHKNFRNADGSTRLLFLWDQQGGRSALSPAGFNYGRELDSAAVNQAIDQARPLALGQPERPEHAYQHLAYRPSAGAHGTHVLDIAAGNGRATGFPGVAPQSDIIFVEVAASDFSDEESFGNSRRLLEAVDYIFTKAEQLGRPAVVNLSLGTHGGPHDGSTLAEQGFDELLKMPNRAVVISAGNAWERRIHASGHIAQNQSRILTWQISGSDVTPNELEVWYAGAKEMSITIVTPEGPRLGPVRLGTTVVLRRSGAQVGQIIHRRADPNNGDNQINILLDRSLPTGNWGIELSTDDANGVDFHAWIERDDRGPSVFAAADDDRACTIGSISCGASTIAVGSYDSRDPDHQLSPFTSEGPTRDGKQKPEVSAPGQAILAAGALGQGRARKSGTSMAAPHVSGVVALLMQAADHPLSVAEIRDAITTTARGNPPAGADWDGRYGMGRADAVGAVGTQVLRPPTPSLEPAAVPTNGQLVQSNGQQVDHLIQVLSRSVADSRVRVRVQIELEPF